MIPIWIRNSSSVKAALSLSLIPSLILAASLAVLSPGFGKTANPAITYLMLSLLASPFVILGFIFSLFTKTTIARKTITITLASVSVLFVVGPIMAVILFICTIGGPINAG